MGSPSSVTSDNERQHVREQITFRFCSECSNMLYPKEDEETRTLQFTCRTCQYSETAQSLCVFRNDINTAVGETAGVTQDVGSDPTVGAPLCCSALPVFCIICSGPVLCVVCSQPDPLLGSPRRTDGSVDFADLQEFRLAWPHVSLRPPGRLGSDPSADYDEKPDGGQKGKIDGDDDGASDDVDDDDDDDNGTESDSFVNTPVDKITPWDTK